MRSTFLSKEDVKQAYQTASLMSSYDQLIDVLHKELIEIILFNREEARQADVQKWINREKQDRLVEAKKAKKWNATHDEDDLWIISPPPHAISYRGVTICGWCLLRDGEPLPPEGCYRHYWDKKYRPKK